MYTIENVKILKTQILAVKGLLTDEERKIVLESLDFLLDQHRKNIIGLDELVNKLNTLYTNLNIKKDTNIYKELNLSNKKKTANPHTRNVYNKRK